MIHAKIMIVDDLWCVVGSTNLDHRSFGWNDEVNLAVADAALAGRLTANFEEDLRNRIVKRWTNGSTAPIGNAEWNGWAGSLPANNNRLKLIQRIDGRK